jgi:hypothetical protein
LSALEAAAAGIKADRLGLPETICEAYDSMTTSTLGELVKALQVQLEAAGQVLGDKNQRMYGELLVGRVALFIATASPMLGDLLHSIDKTGKLFLYTYTVTLLTGRNHRPATGTPHRLSLYMVHHLHRFRPRAPVSALCL